MNEDKARRSKVLARRRWREAPDTLADPIAAATGIPGDTPAPTGAPATPLEEIR